MRTLRLNPFALSTALVAGALGAALFVSSLASAAAPQVTTQAATGITASNATLNATNGDTAATGSAFWVSTSTFSATSSPSPSLPANVYSTGDLGAKATSTAFSAQLSSATIPSGLLPITPNTTYYFRAWTQVGGVWYPGDVLNFTTSPAAPTTTPTISNITVTGISSTTATINWNTDLAGTGQVMYGTTSSYGSTSALNTTASTMHSVTLTGLNPGTTYHFAVRSGNSVGTTTSSDQTFMTSAVATATPLAVTSIDTIDSTGVADGTFENGWKWVMHFTVPDNENAFRIQFSNWVMNGSPSTTFATANNVRISTPQGSNASTTASGMIISAANTYSDWIYLTGDANTSLPGRQIDVTVEVRIPLGTTPGAYTASFVANTTPSTATSTTH